MTTQQFIAKARAVHGNFYDYSKTHYVRSIEYVIIICPEHGEFRQQAASHLMGYGCKWHKGYTLEEFIKKATTIHSDKYDYTMVIYRGTNEYILIICPIHGQFYQTAGSHLEGHGCRRCAGVELTTEDFIAKAKNIHGATRYDYSKVVQDCATPSLLYAIYMVNSYRSRNFIYMMNTDAPNVLKDNSLPLPYNGLHTKLFSMDITFNTR